MPDRAKAGYEYLACYKLSVVNYDYTVVFCDRWISKFSRTNDQMVQASRSGMSNLSEGYTQQSLQGYIKLAGVSRGSEEELLKDYMAFARQNKLTIWPREKSNREIGEIGVIWEIFKKNSVLPDNPHFPDLPLEKEKAVNMMITLINQENFLLDRLIASLREKHKTQGGFTENLYKERIAYRNKFGNS